MTTLPSVLSQYRSHQVRRAMEAINPKPLREVLVHRSILKKPKHVKGASKPIQIKPLKKGASMPYHQSTKFVIGNIRPSIQATMRLSADGRCGLTAGKRGARAGEEMFQIYRPGQYLEQLMKKTKANEKEMAHIKQKHKGGRKRISKEAEAIVRRRIIGDSKRKQQNS